MKETLMLTLVIISCLSFALGVIVVQNIPDTDIDNTNDSLKVHGHVHLEAKHADGTIYAVVDKDNLIVTNGFKGLHKLAFNSNSGISPSTYRYLALGATSTAPNASDTALGSECGYSRQLTSSPTYSSGTSTFSGTFTGATCSAVELALFDASSSGNMFNRVTFSLITLGSSDSITVTYTVTTS